jgi:hypothetical protein
MNDVAGEVTVGNGGNGTRQFDHRNNARLTVRAVREARPAAFERRHVLPPMTYGSITWARPVAVAT